MVFRSESEGGGDGGHIHLSIAPHESSSSATTPSSPKRPVKRPSKHRRWISRGINATNRTDSQLQKIQEIEQLLEQVEESHKTYGLFYSMYNEGRSLPEGVVQSCFVRCFVRCFGDRLRMTPDMFYLCSFSLF